MDDFKLQLSTSTEEYYTLLKDLLFIKSDGNYVYIYTRTGKKMFREKMKNIKKLIEEEGLFKMHGCAKVGKSYILNLNNKLYFDTDTFKETVNKKKKTYYGKILYEHFGKQISIPLSRQGVKLVKALEKQLGRNPYIKLSNNTYDLTAPVCNLNEDAIGEEYIDLGLPSGTKWCISNLNILFYMHDMDFDDVEELKTTTNTPAQESDFTKPGRVSSYFDGIPDDSLDDVENEDDSPSTVVRGTVYEDYRNHVAWGQVVAKKKYEKDHYFFSWGTGDLVYRLYGFPEESDFDYFPWEECNNQLPIYFDVAAHVNNPSIHIPTADDWKELMDNCTFNWCKSCINTYGLLATSKINGRCIFLPASGYRDEEKLINEGMMLAYWTSTKADFHEGKAFTYNNSKDNCKPEISCMDGYLGLSIRPVQGGHLAPNPSFLEKFEIDGTIFRIENPDEKTCSVFSYLGPSPKLVIPETVVYKGVTYTVTTIANHFFEKVPQSIFIPATIRILPYNEKLIALQAIEIASNHPSYSSINGVLFYKDKTNTLRLRLNSQDKVYKVPDGVTRIAEKAFYGSSIEIVDTNQVTRIGANAFQNSNLTRITGEHVKVLERECFRNCVQLETIDFPNVVEVGYRVFKACPKLKHLLFPKVKRCDSRSFEKCRAVSMTFLSQLEKLTPEQFFDLPCLEKIEFKFIPKVVYADPFQHCERLESIIVGGKSYTREEFNQKLFDIR